MSTLKGASLHGLVFDMDGTLTVPCLDFKQLRKELGISDRFDILSYVADLPDTEKQKAMEIIENFEAEGRENLRMQPGLEKLFEFIEENTNLDIGLITRNSKEAVEHFLKKCSENGINSRKASLFSIVSQL